jgi:hypothetical protein
MDMKRNKFDINIIAPLLLFLMALVGCSGVKSEMDKSANLGNFKTYSWKAPDVKTDNPLYKSDLIDSSMKQSIERELANKGLIRNDQNPDIYILYHTYTQPMQAGSSSFYGYAPIVPGYSSIYGPMGYGGLGYSYGYGGYGFGYPYSYYPNSYLYTQETLIIDFIDAKTNKVVWRGSTNSDVTDISHINKQHAKEVHAIIKKYSENSEGKMIKHHVIKHHG